MLKEFTCGLSGQSGSFVRRAVARAGQWESEAGCAQWEEPSPVHHRVSVEGHEENLAATTGAH